MTKPEQYDNAAAELLDEPVLACAPCTRALALSSLALSQVAGAAGIVQSLRGRKQSGGLPQSFLVAVTADAIHFLAQPKVRWNPTPKAAGVITTVPLTSTNVVVADSPLGAKVELTPEGAEPFAFQAVPGAAGARLVERLRQGVPVAA